MKMNNVHLKMVRDADKRRKETELNKSDHERQIDELHAQNKLKSIHIRELIKERKEDKDTIKELREELKNLRLDVTILNEENKTVLKTKNELKKLQAENTELKEKLIRKSV